MKSFLFLFLSAVALSRAQAAEVFDNQRVLELTSLRSCEQALNVHGARDVDAFLEKVALRGEVFFNQVRDEVSRNIPLLEAVKPVKNGPNSSALSADALIGGMDILHGLPGISPEDLFVFRAVLSEARALSKLLEEHPELYSEPLSTESISRIQRILHRVMARNFESVRAAHWLSILILHPELGSHVEKTWETNKLQEARDLLPVNTWFGDRAGEAGLSQRAALEVLEQSLVLSDPKEVYTSLLNFLVRECTLYPWMIEALREDGKAVEGRPLLRVYVSANYVRGLLNNLEGSSLSPQEAVAQEAAYQERAMDAVNRALAIPKVLRQ